ncbi:MAG: sensor histidine kinase [Ottowia sp.]|nr:sensor histidine kinase [Ottowia sp.]
MLSANVVLIVALLYVALLFAVAFTGDAHARRGDARWLHSPIVYTLSISLYCTSWTYYGAVGSAARDGMAFVTIYLGPTLVFVGWWLLLRKMVRIGQAHRITSIADMISSRYGKSGSLAALITVIAVIAITPYIALQLNAVTTSFQVISNEGADALTGFPSAEPDFRIAFWVAAGMAFFTILFGTRNIDVNERHHGVVAAIALEAVVKLVALIAVGLLVVLSMGGGLDQLLQQAPTAYLRDRSAFGATWVTQTFLAATAVICLPRQFQMTVVECSGEHQLRTASWLFPLYMLLVCVFALPIAIKGLEYLPVGANPDMFVLTLPMWAGQEALTLFAFIGGFSSATAMVIVSAIALSTMISNHIIMPVALRLPWVKLDASGDLRRFLLISRRIAITLILLLGFLDFRFSAQSAGLASIGLISFVGIAQFLPPLIAGLYWRHATVHGAFAGVLCGFLVWIYALFLPSFGDSVVLSQSLIEHGPWGWTLLRPGALFGLEGLNPLVHATFWSMTVNVLLLVGISLAIGPNPMERLQATLFIDIFRTPASESARLVNRSATRRDLVTLARRILGPEQARALFQDAERRHGLKDDQSLVSNEFISELERKLAGSVGAASARAMISQVVIGETISLYELKRIADETQRMRDYSRQLEQKSRELAAANDRLRLLDSQKDEFLSQVSHEVRTPMTSIRSLSEILRGTEDIEHAQARRFVGIIHDESIRLTRLLDGILDMSSLEADEQPWQLQPTDPEAILDRAIRACEGIAYDRGLLVFGGPRVGSGRIQVAADPDRLNQVFINLVSNAIKYNVNPKPYVRISSSAEGSDYAVLFEDNGPGIRADERERIFLKFSRGWAHTRTGTQGTGLGLAISHQIMRRLGGTLELLPDTGQGARFRVRMTLATQQGPEPDPAPLRAPLHRRNQV